MRRSKISHSSVESRGTGKGRRKRAATHVLSDRVYDDGGRSIAWRIRDIYRLYASRVRPILSEKDITLAQWYYLRVLSQHDGLSQDELSRLVGIHPNTTVTGVKNMTKKGLVRRVRDTSDRRRFCIFLTDKGRNVRDEMAPVVRELLLRSVRGVTSTDLGIFFGVVDQIWNNLLEEESFGHEWWDW